MTEAGNGDTILPRPVEPDEASALLEEMERVGRIARSTWRAPWSHSGWFAALAAAVVIVGYVGLDAALTFGVRRPDLAFLEQPLGELAHTVYWTVAGLTVLALVARRPRRDEVIGSKIAELLLAGLVFGLGFAVTLFSYQAYNHEYLAPSLFAATLLALAAIEWRTGAGAAALALTARRTGITAAGLAMAAALAIAGSILAAEAAWAVGRGLIESSEGLPDLRLFLSHRAWPALLSAGAFLCTGVVLRAFDRRAR